MPPRRKTPHSISAPQHAHPAGADDDVAPLRTASRKRAAKCANSAEFAESANDVDDIQLVRAKRKKKNSTAAPTTAAPITNIQNQEPFDLATFRLKSVDRDLTSAPSTHHPAPSTAALILSADLALTNLEVAMARLAADSARILQELAILRELARAATTPFPVHRTKRRTTHTCSRLCRPSRRPRTESSLLLSRLRICRLFPSQCRRRQTAATLHRRPTSSRHTECSAH